MIRTLAAAVLLLVALTMAAEQSGKHQGYREGLAWCGIVNTESDR